MTRRFLAPLACALTLTLAAGACSSDDGTSASDTSDPTGTTQWTGLGSGPDCADATTTTTEGTVDALALANSLCLDAAWGQPISSPEGPVLSGVSGVGGVGTLGVYIYASEEDAQAVIAAGSTLLPGLADSTLNQPLRCGNVVVLVTGITSPEENMGADAQAWVDTVHDRVRMRVEPTYGTCS